MPKCSNNLEELQSLLAEGQAARVHYPHPELGFPDDYEYYLEGNFYFEEFGEWVMRVTDEIDNGWSFVDLTDHAPDMGPQRLTYMLEHHAYIELL